MLLFIRTNKLIRLTNRSKIFFCRLFSDIINVVYFRHRRHGHRRAHTVWHYIHQRFIHHPGDAVTICHTVVSEHPYYPGDAGIEEESLAGGWCVWQPEGRAEYHGGDGDGGPGIPGVPHSRQSVPDPEKPLHGSLLSHSHVLRL